ncbi:gustatory receptor 68a-like [Neodiprion pinetum]|uniref:gustatory receptor 68a-like n=1 Tax=Neodiprion pinetum TaxID=441929 RepID=UPI003722878C
MDLNQENSIQVLLSIGLSFTLITSLLYTGYDLGAEASAVLLYDDAMIKIVPATWAIYHILKLVWLINACQAASFEAMRTGALIQSFTESTPIYSGDIHDEVCIFTLQLIQNPLTLTAGGFFTLDYSLLRKMIGSVTTYLVIMIQMRSIYETQHIWNNSTFPTELAENTTG